MIDILKKLGLTVLLLLPIILVTDLMFTNGEGTVATWIIITVLVIGFVTYVIAGIFYTIYSIWNDTF